MSKIFGENLRRLREQAGYKQAKEFAAVVGVPYTTYSSYEKLGREPRYEVLCKIAEALSVSIDELLGYKASEYEMDVAALRTYGLQVRKVSDGLPFSGCIVEYSPEAFGSGEFEPIFFFYDEPDLRECLFHAMDIHESITKDIFLYILKQTIKEKNQEPERMKKLKECKQANWKPEKNIWEEFIAEAQNLKKNLSQNISEQPPVPEDEASKQGVIESPTPEAAPPEQEAPKPRRKRQKNSAPSKNETPSK